MSGQPSAPSVVRRKWLRHGGDAHAHPTTAASASASLRADAIPLPTVQPSPTPSPAASPSPDGWDLSDLIAQYAPTTDTGAETAMTTTDDRRAGRRAAAAPPLPSDEDDDEEEEDEQLDEYDNEQVDAQVDSAHAAAPLAKRARLQANTRFLSNVVRSTLSHNERVEHVGMPMRACGNMDEEDGREIQVFDPRGTFSSHNGVASDANTNASRLSVVPRGGKQIPTSTASAATAGSLESEARKLIAAFEGSAFGAEADSTPAGSQVRKVRGRGRTMAAQAGVGARSVVVAAADSSAAVQRASSGGPFPVGSVAASHLHTAEQRAHYQQTHEKYRRARGVTLLHHIAKVYGINIVIQPAGSRTHSGDAAAAAEGQGDDAEPQRSAESARTVSSAGSLRRSVSTPLNHAVAAATVTHSSGIAAAPANAASTAAASTAAAAPNARPNAGRAFTSSLVPSSGHPASSRAHVGCSTPASTPRDGDEGGTTEPAACSPPPAVTVNASAAKVTFRRTFDTSLVAAPSVSTVSVAPAGAATVAPIVRKVVSLKSRSDSGTPATLAVASTPVAGSPLPSESAVPSAALSSRPSSDSTQPARMSVQLSRKRKGDDVVTAAVAGDSHATASPSGAAAVGGAPAASAPRTASTAHASISSSASAVSVPLAKRKRAGGILGAALRDVVNAARS